MFGTFHQANQMLQVTGHLERDGLKMSCPTLSGKWDTGLWADMEDGSRVELWRANAPPPDPTRCVNLCCLLITAAGSSVQGLR